MDLAEKIQQEAERRYFDDAIERIVKKNFIEDANFALSLEADEVKTYQVDFGNHLACEIKVSGNKIEVLGAVNGWGNPVEPESIIIVEKQALNQTEE